ncbi:MAG: Mll3732 protein, partial [uncultured Solirubrobacteraceae bacterium]
AQAPDPRRPPHHDRRRRPADVDRLLGGRPRHAVRVRAAQPRQPGGEPPLLRPGRRAAHHGVHERGAHAGPCARADRPGLPAPPRAIALERDVPPDRRAPRRARDQAQRGQGPRLHGLDLLHRSAGDADRARVVPLRAADRLHARRRAARGPPHPRRARRLQHRADPPRRRDRAAGHAVARVAVGRPRAEEPVL